MKFLCFIHSAKAILSMNDGSELARHEFRKIFLILDPNTLQDLMHLMAILEAVSPGFEEALMTGLIRFQHNAFV